MQHVGTAIVVTSLLFAFGCARSIPEEVKAEIAKPVDRSTAEQDIATLDAEKASVAEQVSAGARSVVPIGAVAGLVRGDTKGEEPMFKMIGLLKRRPGMTVEEFREYYETKHRVIGEKYLKGHASRYMRRFLTPIPDPSTGNAPEPEYDVVLEIWYPDRATYEATSKLLRAPDAAAEIAEDEEQLFDRPRNRFFFLDESESDLTG